jgi:hypothetical protein
MATVNKASRRVDSQTPQFIEEYHPLFKKFVEYYYKSQEKTGYGQNIVNSFTDLLNIDKLNVDILGGSTVTVSDATSYDSEIIVENVDRFLETNGSVLINNEVIFYEKAVSSPSIALGPGVSYDQVKLKWRQLSNIFNDIDGTRTTFSLISQDTPIAPPSNQHIIVKIFGDILIPGDDYVVNGTNITFITAPRARTVADSIDSCSITYLNGFVEDTIYQLDNVSGAFGEGKKTFEVTRNGERYIPIVDEYVIVIYDNQLLTPKVDYTFDGSRITLNFVPLIGRRLALYSIESAIPSFGNNAVGFSRVNDNGELSDVVISGNGSGYRFQYPPKVTIKSPTGSDGSVRPYINGLKTLTLLSSGRGYSDTNPPVVNIEEPTLAGSITAKVEAVVEDGQLTELKLLSSGSGYTFTPRITFIQPGGALLAPPTIIAGSVSGTITILDDGFGYTTPPRIYIDEPTGENGIKAAFSCDLDEQGQITRVNILNPGQGYEVTPRIAVIDPVGAQVLETRVDGNGRVIDIELLTGGGGYEDIPSVYIVDDRTDAQGNYIGGVGATAAASIFNGQITDINITNFGSGYSPDNPPKVVIQSPPTAKASCEVGLGEITGFQIINSGSGYEKCKFVGCARAASAISGYTQSGDAIFSGDTDAASHDSESTVTCLDAVFVKRVLDKYIEEYLPDIPQLDFESIDVRSAIKNIKTFYSTKGTTFSFGYLFKLLYGENISVSYPKDQLIKPSAATWSINTILRATLVSGDPRNIQDAQIQQFADIADTNIRDASALVENYIAINTAESVIYELVLSEETIRGTFVVPYKTKLAEPLTATSDIITVDSTIGWPERNGEIVIGGVETVRYKEKSLNQFIECTRGIVGTPQIWDSATEVTSNFKVYLNRGTLNEVVMNIVGIVDAQQTTLTDTGSYYLPGDKLTVSKLGGTSSLPQLTTWLYNVKKLIEVEGITFGGVNNQSATVTCSAPHGLLVGDQVTVYGANPILYNGTFLVTSRDSQTVFQYQLPQPAAVEPQGNILISVDLNKGKSTNAAILNAIGPYTTNVQNTFFNDQYVYVASTGIPNYEIGPFPGSALLPGNQRKLNRFSSQTTTISTKTDIVPGPIGTWVNGVSVWSYKSETSRTFGAVTAVNIINSGKEYDAASPPAITISGGGGTGAAASVVVNGSLYEVEVTNGGSGFTSSPLVSIVGGGGSGASATAIITKGVVSRILVNEGGEGYTSQPLITIVGGGGTGAEATASVRGSIKEVNITNGGSSYTSKPSVSLSSGRGAVAQAIVNDGRIISIAIISAGVGYTTAPTVSIQGDGFGAIAKAIIDTDGENAGRVTGVEILNRGIGYNQGTTIINLTSVGQDALFDAEVFQWNYNLQETTEFDSAKGTVFEGYNIQYGGEYAHLSNPQRLRYILGDNLYQDNLGRILEQESQLEHSPILGWAFDGNPIYGPYGYQDPTDQGSNIQVMRSSYSLKTELVFNDITNPYPVRTEGPLLNEEPAGRFIEDYQYVFGSGDLDQYNGRFCKTPEYPQGRYCYFVTIDNSENGNPVFPFIMGPSYNSVVDTWNLKDSSVQQNIPTGVVRYRDPYENVDIDVERTPNASTNALTLEDGDILLFEVEDENRDGVITADEIADPDQVFEEAPLQLFDYFPSVKLDSKVDIEVETISKFENASVTGFTVENAGQNYQVNDRLIFDNEDTGGTGVSARISRIKGESVLSYTYETVQGTNFGILQTQQPHNLIAGDTVFVDYNPLMDNTNKSFIVRQYRGIEEVVVNQTGSGYNTDIPPTIVIDGDGESGKIEAIVDQVGAIKSFNITNSGSGYVNNPRVILSHPQVFKKADYYASLIENNEYVKINDVYVNDAKEVYVCGATLDAAGNTVAFISKLSATGVKEWEKTLETTVLGSNNYTEFQKLYVDGSDIWVTGINKPNIPVLDNYNPDIILCKYEEANNGLSATLDFQKGYAGISGSTRSDNVTDIQKITDTRFLIGGFTNTNSGAPWDAFLAIVDTSGFFVAKRKLASDNSSEKITCIRIVNGSIYFTMETASSDSSNDINVSFGKATAGVSAITIDWIKEISSTTYSFLNSSLAVDEFDEFYVTATLRLKSDDVTRDGFWVGKFDDDGDILWNQRYQTGRDITVVGKTEIDIFGDLNVVYGQEDTSNSNLTFNSVKIKYDGTVLKNTQNEFASSANTTNNIEGFVPLTLGTDNSGDVHIFGQTKWNRQECIDTFSAASATDLTTHHSVSMVGTSDSAIIENGVGKIYGYQPAGTNTVWENSYYRIPGTTLGAKLDGNWTLQFFVYKDGAQTLSQSQQTLIGIGSAQDTTGGLWLGYDTSGANGSGSLQLVISNNTTRLDAASGLSSTLTNMYAQNTWQVITLTKNGTNFKAFVNGIQVLDGNVTNTSFANKDIYIGNQMGWGTNATDFSAAYQGQFYVDHLVLKNRFVTPTVPSDITALPTVGGFGLTFDWVDDAWFTTNLNRYDYIDYVGAGIKVDKDSEDNKTGSIGVLTNTQVNLVRDALTPVTGVSLTVSNNGYSLGGEGFQSLDFNDANTTHAQDTESLEISQDIWGSRTATIPAPGSQKVKATAVVKDRYFFKVTDTIKVDNVQRLTINQPFEFTLNAKLKLMNGNTFVNSGYIIDIDHVNRYVYLAVNNNAWSDDLDTGLLSTEQFDEQTTYGIKGPIPADVNEMKSYLFPEIVNTTIGTFDIDMADFDAPSDVGGTDNLHEFATFKPYEDDQYRVRIDEISGSSPYIPGSVVSLSDATVTFNADYNTINIQGLTGVSKISLTTNLRKILQVSAVSNSDIVYVITDTSHYLSEGEIVFIDGNPTRELNTVSYDEYDGAFPVESVISVKEFTYKLDSIALTDPATNPSDVSVYVKSPTLKMYYGHQYIFDLSHSSLVGGNLSFSKDSLYKLEYSFNSIERIGTPGVTGEGQPTPSVKFKVDENIVTNISYYFDPSRPGADSPVIPGSYLDVVGSPYEGTFVISGVSGATITRGSDTFTFPLLNEPEGNADVANASYSTSSEKAVGSISDIRIVNRGGFYTRLPIVTGIQSNRKIERVQINEPGTEYAPGQYNNVPISGDGEGGLVNLTVENTTDDEGNNIPGQITAAVISASGKGYTTAIIDIASIDGILGPSLNGSGADLEVVIPPFGTGASIFTQGQEVGKIKKLKNNNFGYDYPHDYTLRPEITFPINAQLTSTSILDSITVTDPGSGYSQAPTVVITGGGGSGATAESTIKNGRLDQIIVKDPGSGYSSTPAVELKSSFNYVINLDLGLLQFAFPHGIQNGAEVTLNVVDTGDGAELPLSSGALGRLNGNTTYYAIAGTTQSLDDDQLKLAITETNAELGDSIGFVNAGTGRQQVLTSSFGGAATANVITSTFLEGELVYQGNTFETATATGYVSTNSGWQVGPRILKIVDYDGDFIEGERITGIISKSSGIISDLKIAKGVLEIGSITKTTGQFIDDVGKPSEIIQKIQDSYFYQDFSYAIQTSISISEWKDILVRNVHPTGFKVFGELNISDYSYIPNKETAFELTKSVELAQEAIVPNVQSFSLVEPIYQEFNNTEVLFRQKRLTSSENILTSVVQRLDDISTLFDGVRISFPLTVDGDNVVASANQMMIILNGVVQTPEVAFKVENDSIVFSEPPKPPASVKYAQVTIQPVNQILYTFTNISGIFPVIGNTMAGTASSARATVTKVEGDTIRAFVTEGTFILGELVTVGATGFSANIATETAVVNSGLFAFNETITNLSGDTAIVEEINLESGQETPLGTLRYGIGSSTASFEVLTSDSSQFVIGQNLQVASEIMTITGVAAGPEEGISIITALRGQLGTSAISHLQNAPLYSTEITVTDQLILSKTAGTYQSTPGLFNIQLNDVIIAAQSGVVARVTSTSPYQDPVTEQFISQVNISEGASFFGLLFNRITSINYQNAVLDDISTSQISIVDYDDNATAFNSNFPANELVNNIVIDVVNTNGTLVKDEFIRNNRIDIGNAVGDFIPDEEAIVRKLTHREDNIQGNGFFSGGQVIRNENSKALVIGYNVARKTIYLGRMGRSKSTGEDYHTITFVQDAELNTYNKKWGASALALSKGTSPHTFVSAVADSITADDSSTHTAATGTTYNPISGELVLEIGSHSLTTSNTITFANDAITFTCGSDDNNTELSHPRAGIEQSGQTLAITAVTATTITVDGGAVPVDEYVTIPTSTDFGFGTGNFTIECWVKCNSMTGTKAILDFRSAATEVAPYLYIDGGNVRYYNNGSNVIAGTTALTSGTWYHIALSKDGSNTRLFVNGTQDGSTYSDGSNYGTTKPVRIGGDYNGNNAFPGYIDEVRISTNSRYTANFTAPSGIHQGDANTVLLIHFDGEHQQKYTEDWSGVGVFAAGNDFGNDAIRETQRKAGAPSGYNGKTHRYADAANLLLSNQEFLAKEVVAQLVAQYPSLTIPGGNVNCEDDISDAITELVSDLRNGSNSAMWDAAALYVDRTANPVTISHVETEIDETIWAYNKLAELAKLVINNQAVTVVGTHGLTQTLDNTLTDSGDDGNPAYTTGDCTDVKNTIDSLVNIVVDTLTQANLPTPVDHLGTITRVIPAYSYKGAYVDSFYEVEVPLTDVFNNTEVIYSNQIDGEDRNRFYDAANLIRLNRSAIVDKAAYDLIDRYPDLALSMPRNQDGSGSGTLRCKTDLGLILDAIANDIQYGGNFNTVEGIKFYLGQNDEIIHIRLQLLFSLYAHTRLGYYMKQAITGDLTSDNTDSVIVGDWGITNDPGNCANVQSAIDTLIDLANDMLAPTGDRFRDAGDLLHFNREFIADESTLILDADFTYNLGPTQYQAFTYPNGATVGRSDCKDDIKDILTSIISDLLTGGNSNTIRAINFYLTAGGGITQVEDEILPTIYAFQKVKMLGKKAINNLLLGRSGGPTGDQYRAVYTFEEPYTDLTITDSNGDSTYSDADCADVIAAFENLMDLLIDTLTPGGIGARGAGRMLLFNENYYRDEIQNRVSGQWGSSAWSYNTFLGDMLDNTIHDMVTTDASSYITARTIILSGVTNDYTVGNTVSSSGGGTATILEWYPKLDKLVVGSVTGTAFSDGDTLTEGTATGTITSSGISATYNYYQNISNVETLKYARTIQSTVQGSVVFTNLFTNPEQYSSNWTFTQGTFSDDVVTAPDGEFNADLAAPNTNVGQHFIYRDYNLTSFTTFDGEGTRFDTDTETFDTGSRFESQTFTFSAVLKAKPGADPYDKVRFAMILDPGATSKDVVFDLNLGDGTFGSVFADAGATVEGYGSIPLGDGWYRAYLTITFSFGIGVIRNQIFIKNNSGLISFAGNGTDGIYVWGAKLAKGAIDPYVSVSGTTFYADNDYNIKNYILDSLEEFYEQAMNESLVNPSPLASFIPYTNSVLSSTYTTNSWISVIKRNFNILREQLLSDSYISTIDNYSGVTVPASTYGTRSIPIPLGGSVGSADNIYGLQSDAYAEIEVVRTNQAKIVEIYQRFRINGDIVGDTEDFAIGEVLTSGGASCTVYAKYEDENNKYFDVVVTTGTFAVLGILTGESAQTAEIGNIENRIQVVERIGTFDQSIEFKGYTSGATADVEELHLAEGAVLSNTGGKLTLDTESLVGEFERTSIVYPESSSEYLEVAKFAGFDVKVGDRVASSGHVRLGINIINNQNTFVVGNYLYRVISGVLRDDSNYGIITEVDLDNNYIYVSIVSGNINNSDFVADYGTGDVPLGFATVSTKIVVPGAAAGLIQDIQTVGVNKRLYLTDVIGTFSNRDTIISVEDYRAAVVSRKELRARVRRFFRGFDSVQTNFKLTTNNGDPYFPDPAGHMLIFVNGILQPPGPTNAYTAFSDEISFTEAPEIGSSFTGFYLGKLRQLDDISFDFDSLRQSFNLKRSGTFYSLTLTDGVQSTTIRPENNIIISLNGVIQEPGVGFEIVGSRLIFSEIPRVGSTFVAFSYIGSDQDVEAADVVPPIEPGDFIDIQGETDDREVAVIESSNSLITFDYLGSVFGKGADATAVLTSGRIENVSVTAGGSGYASRPNVRVDSISGFDAQIRALVGVSNVVIGNGGSGYSNPGIDVETSVPDDWVAPNLADYGEEAIDPEIL